MTENVTHRLQIGPCSVRIGGGAQRRRPYVCSRIVLVVLSPANVHQARPNDWRSHSVRLCPKSRLHALSLVPHTNRQCGCQRPGPGRFAWRRPPVSLPPLRHEIGAHCCPSARLIPSPRGSPPLARQKQGGRASLRYGKMIVSRMITQAVNRISRQLGCSFIRRRPQTHRRSAQPRRPSLQYR